MSELLYLNLTAFQAASDKLIAPKTIPIWHDYLTILFSNTNNDTIDLENEVILSSKADMTYVESVVEYLIDLPLDELEVYIWWTITEEMILHTTSDIRKLQNEYAKKIANIESGQSRSIYCTSGVNQLMGMAVSYAIAEEDFFERSYPKVHNMLGNIREAFNNLVRQTTWMDAATKRVTLEKSNAMKSLIGFPKWILEDGKLDDYYGGVVLSNETHLVNLVTLLTWQMRDMVKKWKAPDEFDWATTPTNVNAFHTFQANAISQYTIHITHTHTQSLWSWNIDELIYSVWLILKLRFFLFFSCAIGHSSVSFLQLRLGVSWSYSILAHISAAI